MPKIRLLRKWVLELVKAFSFAKAPLHRTAQLAVQVARLMVGIPDYQTYVSHRKEHHPNEPVMSYEEFFWERQNARFACGDGKFRGCC
jgi:uncharacterized short protein YbdD (DUF466 family)